MPKICISKILGNQVRRNMLEVLGKKGEMSREEYRELIKIPEFQFKMNLDYLIAGELVEILGDETSGEIVKITELGKGHVGQEE